MRILPARWLPVPVVALVVLLATCAPALATSSLQVPPVHYRERTLPNGLQVLSVEDHASPTVAVQVWYHVGSKDDPQGRSGFAHLFEHLMFKSTAHMKRRADRPADRGRRRHQQRLHRRRRHQLLRGRAVSNYLQTLLWAEAERMSNLNVDDRRTSSPSARWSRRNTGSACSPPYGGCSTSIDPQSYAVHPYKRPAIGSIEDLEAATLQDVIAFHETFYRPDNATLIVAGDFDPEQLDAWVDQYFAWIPKPATPIPQVAAQEPARSQDKRYTETSGPRRCRRWRSPG